MARGKRANSNEEDDYEIKRQKSELSTTSNEDHELEPCSIEPRRNVDKLNYGSYEIEAWYYAPYPAFPPDFNRYIETLYVCDTCLRYMGREIQLAEHKGQCTAKKPPGKVIYTDSKIKVYEVDGQEHKLYCQNLCLMAKLFLDNKTLYYDTEGFKFYVLTEHSHSSKYIDNMVGYFSKEKLSYDNYNLACIMVLPSHQRKGYGKLLIDLSYELSKLEGKIGSPEKPLSQLGSIGYFSYWTSTIVSALLNFNGNVTIKEISEETRIHEEDIIDTLSRLGLLKYRKLIEGVQNICITSKQLQEIIENNNISLKRRLNPKNVKWK